MPRARAGVRAGAARLITRRGGTAVSFSGPLALLSSPVGAESRLAPETLGLGNLVPLSETLQPLFRFSERTEVVIRSKGEPWPMSIPRTIWTPRPLGKTFL